MSIFKHTNSKQILDIYTLENKSLLFNDGHLRMRIKTKNKKNEEIFVIMYDAPRVKFTFTKYIPFIENKLKTVIHKEKYKLGSRVTTSNLKKSYIYTLLGWMKEYDSH